MMTSEQEFLSFMDINGFVYDRIEHPAVFTCAEANLYHSDVMVVSTKNLFLCDKKKRRFFLSVTSCEKTVKLNSLSSQLNASHLRFASEENLMRLLGVTRGSVTMMGLVNDTGYQVEVWVDVEIWHGENFLCHPLTDLRTRRKPPCFNTGG